MSWPPTHDLLDELAAALASTDAEAWGHTTWFDSVEHAVLMLTVDPDEELDPPDDTAPAWQREEHALARRIRQAPGRYRRVPAMGTPGRLRGFIEALDDAQLRDALWDEARGGRGAYRRVRDALARRGLEHLWHDHEQREDREQAREWLRSQGLLAEPPPEP